MAKRISREQTYMLGAYSIFLALISILLWDGNAPAQTLFADGPLWSMFILPVLGSFAMPATLLIKGFLASGSQQNQRPFLPDTDNPRRLCSQNGNGPAAHGHVGQNPQNRSFTGFPTELIPFAIVEASAVLLLFTKLDPSFFPGFAALIPACLGIATGLIFCLFQQTLSLMPLNTAGFVVIGSAPMSSFIYFILLPLHYEVRLWISLLILIPLCAFLYVRFSRKASLKHLGAGAAASQMQKTSRCTHQLVSLIRGGLFHPLICISLSAFIVGILNGLPVTPQENAILNTIKMAGLCVSGIILFIIWDRMGGEVSFTVLYRLVFPLVATAYLLLPLLYESYAYLLSGLSYLVFSIVSALMVLTCLKESIDTNLPPVAVYGIFAGIVYASLALGGLVGLIIEPTSWNTTTVLLAIALVMVYILGFVNPNRQNLFASRSSQEQTSEAYVQHEEESLDSIAARSELLGAKCGLSSRETQVLELLAHGRDVPTIARILNVSENTVRTHTKNIYIKADVHTKQELLDKLETMD